MTIDELLRDAERKQRRELEQEARKSIELRTRLPSLVRKAVAKDLDAATAFSSACDCWPLSTAGMPVKTTALVAAVARTDIA